MISCDATATGIIKIPDGVTIIEESAFLNCSKLTGVIIPSSVKNIKSYAFLGCTSLTYVYYEGSETNWKNITINKDAFNNINNLTIRYKNSSGNNTVSTYTVIFKANDGTNYTATQTLTVGIKQALTANMFTRAGYVFDGWTRNANGGGDYYTDCAIVKDLATTAGATVTLYAQWTPANGIAYTVTFDSDGGNMVATQTIEHGKTVTTPTNPTKEGYTFDGWYYNDGSKFDFSTQIKNDITLTAKWTINSCYTVMFDGGNMVATQTIEHGKTATYPANPIKEGYIFDGWYYNDGSKFDFSTQIKNDITLTAKWTINSYTVTFDSDGGSTVATQTVEHGKTATYPAKPVKEGYTFDGWYYNGSKFDFSTQIKNDITLTAMWTINSYIVTFDSDGGSTVATQTVEHGKTATYPAKPVKEGYTFDGWYYNGSKFDFSTQIKSDIILIAHWSAGSVTVTTPQYNDIKLTITQDGTNVTLTADTGYTDYTWLLDGKVLTGTGNSSLTLDTTDWLKGAYEMTVEAQKGSNWYSATVYITIGGN